MTVIANVVLRGVTKEQYDAVRTKSGWLEQPPDGGLAHLSWWAGSDCHNTDAWADEAAFNAFTEQRLAPALAANGITAEPEVTFHAAHEVFLPRAQVIAPTAAPPTGAPTGAMTPQGDNAALLRAGYAAFAAGDIATVLEMFAPSATWDTSDSVRFGGSYRGPSGIAEFFSHLAENFAELNVRPMSYIDRDDTVVVLGTHEGRTRAGVDFRLPFVHVWTFDNGKVSTFAEHLDTAKLNAALDPEQAR